MQAALFKIPIIENMTVISPYARLVKQSGKIHVFLNGNETFEYAEDDNFSRNIVIVNLTKNKMGSQEAIAEAFNVGVNQPRRLFQRFEQYGLNGIYPLKIGPRGRHKITPDMHNFIIWKLRREMGISQILRDVEKKFNTQLSRSAIEIIRKSMPIMAAKPLKVENLKFEFEIENERPIPTPSMPADKELQPPSVQVVQADVSTVTDSESKALVPEQEHIAHAGLFMLWGFLQRMNFMEILNQVFSELNGRFYFVKETFLTLFFAIYLRIQSVEDYKLLQRHQLAPLWGARCSMDLRTLRRKLDLLKTQQKGGDFLFALSKAYINIGLVQTGVLYFDGHFLPYYGKHKLSKGFFTQRRLAMPGQEQFFVNDLKGRPFFFMLKPANKSFIKMIPELVRQVRELTGQHEIAIVFDRGGFSTKLFHKLDQDGVLFYTYLKNPQFKVDESAFASHEIKYRHLTQKAELAEVGIYLRDEQNVYCYRDIVRKKQKKQTHVITNDMTHSIEIIASLMFNRWGQENFFKYMVTTYHLNSLGTYLFENSSQKIVVKNPERAINRQQVQSLKKELAAVEEKLLKRLSSKRNKNKLLSDVKNQSQDLLKRQQEIQALIQKLNAEHKKLPIKVPVTREGTPEAYDLLQEDKKLILDSIKLLAYNAEEWLLEHLAHVYKNKNDIRRILFKIAKQPGTVVQHHDQLWVTFAPFESLTHQKIAQGLCELLNELEIQSPLNRGKIRFAVAETTH